uniref:Transcription elongation factor A N-terminal and central domain containing n=1 Tax=Oryzias sinensis TaxID=183150 RepID=A0A8C7YIL6_9TELE
MMGNMTPELHLISAGRRGSGNAAVLLNRLEKFRVTAEEVEITGLEEVLLRLLRSSEELSFREKVQGLLRRWRSGDRGGVKDQLRSTASPGGSEEDGVLADPEPTAVKAPEPQSSGEEPGLQSPGSTAERRSASLDSARSKCVQLLLAALLPDPPEQEQAAELAGAIEEHIHQLHKPNQLRYKTCVRSKVANLRNPKNPHLRRGLLSGSLLPQAFARMSAEEMAGPELRRLREEICRRGVNERQLPRPEEGTPTRGVRCRRGDAMTFVTCSVCGQQWYHSRWSCL